MGSRIAPADHKHRNHNALRTFALVANHSLVLPRQELEEASNAMGYGAVKYADLKNQRLTNYKFNFDQMLNLTGNTAVYLLYAHARIAGIIRKSAKDTAGGQQPNASQSVCESVLYGPTNS